jgi:hypothetical protein
MFGYKCDLSLAFPTLRPIGQQLCAALAFHGGALIRLSAIPPAWPFDHFGGGEGKGKPINGHRPCPLPPSPISATSVLSSIIPSVFAFPLIHISIIRAQKGLSLHSFPFGLLFGADGLRRPSSPFFEELAAPSSSSFSECVRQKGLRFFLMRWGTLRRI